MKLRYSIFLFAAISATAIAKYEAASIIVNDSLKLPSFTAAKLTELSGTQDNGSTLYNPLYGRNSEDPNKSEQHTKALSANNDQALVFGYSGSITGSNSAGSYSALASAFGSSAKLSLGGNSQSPVSSLNQVGGDNSASRSLSSVPNNGSAFSDVGSPTYNNVSNASIPGANFPSASTATSNSDNQVGGASSPSPIVSNTTSKIASDLYKFDGVKVPELAVPALPKSSEIINNISTFQQPSGLLASNDPFSWFSGIQSEIPTSIPSLPKTLKSTPYIAPTTNIFDVDTSSPATQIATNSVEAPAEPSILSSPALTVTNLSGTPSSASPANITVTSSNSGATPAPANDASKSSTSNSSTASGTSSAAPAAAATHEDKAITAGTPVVTVSNATTAAPATESTKDNPNLTKVPSPSNPTKSSLPNSLQLYDPNLPAGIPNGNAFSFSSINHEAPVVAKLFPEANSFCTSGKYKQLVEYVLQGSGFAKNPPDKAMSVMGFGDNYEDVINKCVVPNAELSKEFASYLDSALNNQCRSLLKNYEVPMVIVNPYGEQYIKNSSDYSYITRIFSSESNKKVYYRCNNIYALRNNGSFKDIKPTFINEDKFQHSLTASSKHSSAQK
ncbi:MAG: hypothetical protein KA116_12570 [Proteobacteria bacterium]|nr:hypothetical protein [Pseudomonadota bacterium]